MRVTRRAFLGTASLTVGALSIHRVEGQVSAELGSLSPAINPVYLTGGLEDWPLAELAQSGYRGLEITPACLANPDGWRKRADEAGFGLLAVNALEELRPYLTGSLSDAVEWRRRATLDRLLETMEWMRKEGVPYLVVAPSRIAENYQSRDEARGLLIESLKELSRAGGVTVLLQSAPFRLFHSAGEIAPIIDDVHSPNLAAALDVGHALLAGENPRSAAEVLGDRLRYVMVHDADTRPGVPRLDRHLPFGKGTAKREDVKAVIGDRPFSVGVADPRSPLESATQALEWLRKD